MRRFLTGAVLIRMHYFLTGAVLIRMHYFLAGAALIRWPANAPLPYGRGSDSRSLFNKAVTGF